MNASEARDHLEMVDRILARTTGPMPLSPYPYLIWGIAGAILQVIAQLVFIQNGSHWLFAISMVTLAAAIALTCVWSVQLHKEKEQSSLIGRQVFYVFNAAWIVALGIQLGAATIFPTWAQAALWVLTYGMAMLFVGMLTQNRPTFVGGCVMLLSIVAANFAPPYAGYLLGLGDLLGMAGAGVVLLARRA
jgi:hypothetical protein